MMKCIRKKERKGKLINKRERGLNEQIQKYCSYRNNVGEEHGFGFVYL